MGGRDGHPPGERVIGSGEDALFEDFEQARNGDVDEALTGKFELYYFVPTFAILGIEPSGSGVGDVFGVVSISDRLEPEMDLGVAEAGELRDRTLGDLDLDVVGLNDIEKVAFVGQLAIVWAADQRNGIASGVNDGNRVAVFGSGQDLSLIHI